MAAIELDDSNFADEVGGSKMAIVDFQDLLQSDRKVALLKELFDRDLVSGFQFDQPINLV